MKQNETGAAKIAQLEVALNKLEFDLQTRYCEFGKTILELAQKEQKEVNVLVDKLIKTRKCLSIAKGEWQCPKCFAYNDENGRFCRHCGEELVADGDAL